MSLAWQRGSVREKCNCQHSMAHPRKPPYKRKNLLRKPSYSQFCPKFRCHGNGGRWAKMWLAAFNGPSPTPHRRKNLADIFYTDRVIANFVLNFVAMATGVGRRKCVWQHSIAHHWKPSYRRKNLADISYTKRVIAHFVPNFVAMAIREDRSKILLAAFDGPTPKTPQWTQRSRRYL